MKKTGATSKNADTERFQNDSCTWEVWGYNEDAVAEESKMLCIEIKPFPDPSNAHYGWEHYDASSDSISNVTQQILYRTSADKR